MGPETQSKKSIHFLKFAAILGAASVILGAFGAHALRDRLSPEALATFQTGVTYQFYHALALFILGTLGLKTSEGVWFRRSGSCFIAGTGIFSGSLYLLVFTGMKWFGAITPIGGVLFIVGWIFLALAVRDIRSFDVGR